MPSGGFLFTSAPGLNLSQGRNAKVSISLPVRARCSMARGRFLVAFWACLMVGCNDRGLPNMVPIRGKVLYNGRPVEHGIVKYVPVSEGNGRVALGTIQPDGTFIMTTLKKGDGVQKGEYRIAVIAPQPFSDRGGQAGQETKGVDEVVLPVKFGMEQQSGLTDKVGADHSGYKELILTDP